MDCGPNKALSQLWTVVPNKISLSLSLGLLFLINLSLSLSLSLSVLCRFHFAVM